jgi:succinyl-diaminopimelate desuccinylase
MKDNTLLKLTEKLIRLKTIPDHPEQLEAALQLVVNELSDFTIEWFEKEGSKSVLVYNQSKRPENFRVILNTHLDVIPGSEQQYSPYIEGDRLYGVGAMDMKGNLVAALLAFRSVAKNVDYPLAIQFVTDEEIGGFLGTKYQVDSGVLGDFVIATEPTNFEIVYKAKGVLWLDVTAQGETAHGAYPWRGKNAVERMNELLNVLQRALPNPTKEAWSTTVNIASISTTNTAYNKIPDECTAKLDIRFIPEDAPTILETVQSLLPERFTYRVVAQEAPLDTQQDLPDVKLLAIITEEVLGKEAVFRRAQGSSDARHFAKVGCAGIEFGPVGEGIGADNEWVSISSLQQYQRILEKYLRVVGTEAG